MSSTVSDPVSATPTTDRAVEAANTIIGLAHAAEKDPIVMGDLQTAFDSFSHSGAIIPGIAALVGMLLMQKGIQADNFTLTLLVGGVVTGVSYLAQKISMLLHKPTVLPKAA